MRVRLEKGGELIVGLGRTVGSRTRAAALARAGGLHGFRMTHRVRCPFTSRRRSARGYNDFTYVH